MNGHGNHVRNIPKSPVARNLVLNLNPCCKQGPCIIQLDLLWVSESL